MQLPLLHAAATVMPTIRSTGPIAACRHLGQKSLAQMPAHHNGPVSSNVRPHETRHLAARMLGVGCSSRRETMLPQRHDTK